MVLTHFCLQFTTGPHKSLVAHCTMDFSISIIIKLIVLLQKDLKQ